ncbi:hypothetical protein K2X05_01620 [bacterium]|nr:hypothetical protein [bacterium]
MKKFAFSFLTFSLLLGCSTGTNRDVQSTVSEESERTLCENGTGPLAEGEIFRFSRGGAVRTKRGSRIGTQTKSIQEGRNTYEIDLSFESANPAERVFKAEEQLEVAEIKDNVVRLRTPKTLNDSVYELKCFQKLSATSRTEEECTHTMVSVFFKQVKADNCTVLEVERSGQTSP